MLREVVITGIGIVSCLGTGRERVMESLREGRSGIVVDPEREKMGFRSPLTAAITDFEPPKIDRKKRRTITDFGLWAYAAALEAIEHAGWQEEEVRSPETGLIIGNDSSTIANMEQVDITRAEGSTLQVGAGRVFQALNSTVSMNLNTLLGNQGASWTVSGACASGGHAVGQAADLIALGRQERVLCGGVQEINWPALTSFDATNAFSTRTDDPEGASRPFDASRDGLIPGGGAVIIALERRETARMRGATMLGRVLSYGFTSDGCALAVPSGDGLEACMLDCLRRGGVAPEKVDCVAAHATSTPVGDAVEAEALARVFGEYSEGARVPWITAFKSMTGHEMWMAGAAQVAYGVLMRQAGCIAPTINFERQDPGAPRLRLSAETIEQPIRHLLCNSAGFGGTNELPPARAGPAGMTQHSVVIGSGVSGLAAAVVLAKAGRNVTLVEQANHLAPLLRRFRRAGAGCDGGLHYLGGLHEGGGMAVFLRALGVYDDLQICPMNPEAFDKIETPNGKSVSLPQNFDHALEALAEVFPSDIKVIAAFLERMRGVLQNTPFSNPDIDPEHWSPPDESKELVADMLRRHGASSAFVRTLAAYTPCLHGVPLAEVSYHVQGMVVGAFIQHAAQLQGGGDNLAGAFQRQLDNLGVRIITGARAIAIHSEGRSAMQGVRIENRDGNEEMLPCDECVATLHPARLIEILPEGLMRQGWRDRIINAHDTPSLFVAYFGVEGDLSPLRGTNHFLVDYHPNHPELDRIWAVMALSPVAQANAKESLCAVTRAWTNDDPIGCTYRFSRLCRQRGGASYERYRDAMTGRIMGQLETHWPQFKGRIEPLAAATPCAYEAWTGTRHGSAYGLMHTVKQARPPVQGPVRGLYLAGQSVGVPGIMGSMISGAVAASYAVGWSPLREWMHACR